MKIIRTIICSILLLFSVDTLSAQENKEDSMLNSVLEKLWDNNLRLKGSRGLEMLPSDYTKVKTADVLKVLGDWDSSKYKIGMLIYVFDEHKDLSITYLNNSRSIINVTLNVSATDLILLEKKLKSAIGATYLSTGNQTRGLKVKNKDENTNIDSLVNIISRILLPVFFHLDKLDHLIIVPTLNIAAFPFAMLQTGNGLLIDKMSYSIIPSINEFVMKEKINNKKYYGDIYGEESNRSNEFSEGCACHDSLSWSMDSTVLIGNPSFRPFAGWNFNQLPGAEKEINEISKGLDKKIVLKGKDATKKNVLHYLSKSEIVYFATHAIADSANPLAKSFLLLAGNNAADAFLTTKEIQDLAEEDPIKAFLIVLSACETGLGKYHDGGMIGIARAFQIAGAQNVLMSLWEISDRQTPVLMKYFFDYLHTDGKPQMFLPYGALQKAIIRYKKENNNPLFWAAFSLFGVPL